jgi:hypothetical protein
MKKQHIGASIRNHLCDRCKVTIKKCNNNSNIVLINKNIVKCNKFIGTK